MLQRPLLLFKLNEPSKLHKGQVGKINASNGEHNHGEHNHRSRLKSQHQILETMTNPDQMPENNMARLRCNTTKNGKHLKNIDRYHD